MVAYQRHDGTLSARSNKAKLPTCGNERPEGLNAPKKKQQEKGYENVSLGNKTLSQTDS